MYTTYEYYINVFGGTLDADTFDIYCKRASMQIDRVTFGRLKEDRECPFSQLEPDDWDCVNFATCRVIESLHESDKSGGKKVASVSNDGYTETYESSGRSDVGDALTAAIENLPYYLIETSHDWRLP
jgi:hypothetical protein